MILWLSIVVLLATLSPQNASSLRVSSSNNTIIELRNKCKCVRHYLCDENNNIVEDGRGIITARIATNVSRIECHGGSFPNEIVCCKLNNSDIPLGHSHRSTERFIPITLEDKPTCGKQKTLIKERGFFDENKPIDGDFGWVAAIFNKTSYGSYMFHCSGSLIHPKVVLTANHCVHRKSPGNFVIVVNGRTKISIEKTAEEEKRGVSEIIKHPKYATSGRLSYDFALLILEKPFPVEGTDFINTLCLPPRQINLETTDCLVVGWEVDERRGYQTIKSVEVAFVGRDQCQNRLRKTRLGEDFTLDKSFMCAEQNWKDDYRRDSGSPLMCLTSLDGDQYFQAGIVSWGDECGLENTPGVYASVLQVVDWIKDELRDRDLKV